MRQVTEAKASCRPTDGTAGVPSSSQSGPHNSRRYLYRDGEGRWSSDPNTSGYWHLGYRTGRLETYKHIIGGKVVNGVWRLSAKNYPNPALVSSTSNYGSTNAWLAEKGRQNVTAGTTYNETSW